MAEENKTQYNIIRNEKDAVYNVIQKDIETAYEKLHEKQKSNKGNVWSSLITKWVQERENNKYDAGDLELIGDEVIEISYNLIKEMVEIEKKETEIKTEMKKEIMDLRLKLDNYQNASKYVISKKDLEKLERAADVILKTSPTIKEALEETPEPTEKKETEDDTDEEEDDNEEDEEETDDEDKPNNNKKLIELNILKNKLKTIYTKLKRMKNEPIMIQTFYKKTNLNEFQALLENRLIFLKSNPSGHVQVTAITNNKCFTDARTKEYAEKTLKMKKFGFEV